MIRKKTGIVVGVVGAAALAVAASNVSALTSGQGRVAQGPDHLAYSYDNIATTLPVDLSTSTWRDISKVSLPVNPGDTVKIEARARVTNDNSYVVGVGFHTWVGPLGGQPKARVGASSGDNVDRTRHHLPLVITDVYRVPATHKAGDFLTFTLRADAHSTAWKSGDVLKVDSGYNLITAERWR
jgi:hypothetical protein